VMYSDEDEQYQTSDDKPTLSDIKRMTINLQTQKGTN
jgi:hypothetical protein